MLIHSEQTALSESFQFILTHDRRSVMRLKNLNICSWKLTGSYICNMPGDPAMEFTIRLFNISSEIANANFNFRAVILELV